MTPTLLLLPLLASLLLLLHRSHADCDRVTCGNLTVKYPFWLGGPGQSNSSCGHPAFEIWCSHDGSVASLKGSYIHVLRIDYGNSAFVASHGRVGVGSDGVCRADFNMSSSLAFSSFNISPSNRALCFLYSCNGTEPRGREYVNATSTCGRPIYAYLGGSYDSDTPPGIPVGSCTYAYLPVLGSEEAVMTAANYSRLLKDGFVLEWGGTGIRDCAACSASGGQCRYRTDTAAFACRCPSGALRSSTCAATSTTRALNTTSSCELAACGDLRIAYPLWLGGTHPPECGYRAFQVTCDSKGTASLKNSFWTYQILDISYANSSFRVTNVELSDGACDIKLYVVVWPLTSAKG